MPIGVLFPNALVKCRPNINSQPIVNKFGTLIDLTYVIKFGKLLIGYRIGEQSDIRVLLLHEKSS